LEGSFEAFNVTLYFKLINLVIGIEES